MPASELARFFDELYRTGRASAGASVTTLDASDPGLPALDRVLAGRVDWHVRGLPGVVDTHIDPPTARSCAHALYELLCLAIEPASERPDVAPALVAAVPPPHDANAAVTLDALLIDAPRIARRLEVARGDKLLPLFRELVAKSPMTLLRFCGASFAAPANLQCIVGSRALTEEAVALLAFPGGDPARLRALGAALAALLGAGGPQTQLALRAYEVFSFFCARTASREPAGGGRHALDVRALAAGGALGPDERAIAEYLRPLGVVTQSPRLDDVLAQHPRLSPELLEIAKPLGRE